MQTMQTKPKKINPFSGRKLGVSIAIFLLLAITGGIWYWNTHKKTIIKNKLETAVREKSDGLYKIKYDSLDMDEIGGYLSISNMNLTYDSSRYLAIRKSGKEPAFLLNIQIPEISVSGVKTPRALIEKEISGRKLEIKNPVINIMYTNLKDTARSLPQQEIYEQILGNLNLIQADTVLVTGAQITTSNHATKKTGIRLQDVFITLVNVKVDSTGNADTSRIFFAKEATVSCGKLTLPSANKLYDYSVTDLSVNSVSRLFRIKNFRVIPALNEEAFVNALPTQDDRFDISISNIEIQNINLPLLFEEKIIADNLLIPAMSLKIYRDLEKPRDTKNRLGTYPQQLLHTIPVTFRVKKVVVTNGVLEYKEKSSVTRQSGKVRFNDINLTLTNVTNDKKAIAANQVMTATMGAKFLGKTPLKASWKFYHLHPKGRFDLEGSLGAIEGSSLNSLTEPMGPATIEKGRFNGAEFNLQGHDYGIDGSVKLLYEDLKVAMLEKDQGSDELDKKSLTSFLANLIVKNSNPKRNDPVRVAQVHLERDMNHSIFYLIWKAFFKGIKETVGIKK
jgi:hypothetical protein